MYMRTLDETVNLEGMRHSLQASADDTSIGSVIDMIEACAKLLDSVSPANRDPDMPTRALIIPIARYEEAVSCLETLMEVLDVE